MRSQFDVGEPPNIAIDNFLMRRLSKRGVQQLLDQQRVSVRRGVTAIFLPFIDGSAADDFLERHLSGMAIGQTYDNHTEVHEVPDY